MKGALSITQSPASRTKALLGNYNRCTVKDIHDHIRFVMDGDRIDSWYFIMGIQPCKSGDAKSGDAKSGEFSGDGGEFIGGQFIGRITATDKYPYGPPDVEMLTPTGVFPINNKNFCIDIGKYHADNYPATLGMDGYTKMVWSGLVGWQSLGHGINLLQHGKPSVYIQVIRKASADSIEYNIRHNAHVLALFTGTV